MQPIAIFLAMGLVFPDQEVFRLAGPRFCLRVTPESYRVRGCVFWRISKGRTVAKNPCSLLMQTDKQCQREPIEVFFIRK